MLIPPAVTSALAKPSLPLGRKRQSARRRCAAAQLGVGEIGELAPQADLLRQRLGQPAGQQFAEQGVEMRLRPRALRRQRPVRRPDRAGNRSPISSPLPPVGGDLQDRRAGQAAMGEQGRLAERGLAGAGDDLGGDAGQLAEQQILVARASAAPARGAARPPSGRIAAPDRRRSRSRPSSGWTARRWRSPARAPSPPRRRSGP